MSLVRSELRKVRYARSYRYLLLSSAALSILSCVASPYAVHTAALAASGVKMSGLDDPAMVSGMYAKSVAGYILVVVIGVLMMAGEFRNNTAVATFLAAPRRASVLGAKLLVAAGFGVVVMVVSMGLGVAACWVTLRQFPEAVSPAAGTFTHLVDIAVVSGAVLAVIGVALGTLIRNQTVAIVVTIVWLYVIDTLLILLWPTGGKYLPSGLITGMMSLDLQAQEQGTNLGIDTTQYLHPVPATLGLVGYGVVFAIVASVTTLRRDVD